MDDVSLQMMGLSLKGYYCSQILLTLALEAQGRQDPDLVRSMAGLAMGVGTGSGTCGALTGAACMIALYAGKGQDSEAPLDDFWLMLSELWEWFDAEVGTTCGGVRCDDIVPSQAPGKQACSLIVADTYSKVLEILVDHGIDPTEPRSD